MEKGPSTDNLCKDLVGQFHEAMESQGITAPYLARKLKRELNAKETKIVKAKGLLTDNDLPKTKNGNLKPGIRIIGTSGVIETFTGPDGKERMAGDGDTILEIDFINWRIQQEARKDAHKLRGDYPAEKYDHNIKRPVEVNVVNFTNPDGDPDNGDQSAE